jgi:glycolate oxidase
MDRASAERPRLRGENASEMCHGQPFRHSCCPVRVNYGSGWIFDPGSPTLARSRIPLIEELIKILGKEQVITEREGLAAYSTDATSLPGQLPAIAVFPRTSDEVAAVVRLAHRLKVPVVTRGSGTGLSGGCIPSPGSIVVCLVRMDRIVELDARNFTIRAQAGAITQAIYDAADKAGLFYPPDPGSMRESTIGGNVAENAGGLRGLKYGVTRDYVLGLEVVLADGEICHLGNKCVKDVAGYSMKDLFVGSEGTLGIVTEVLLKLLPKPAARQTLLATYAHMDTAADAVTAIIASGIVPCTLEFLDSRTLRCVEDFTHAGLPVDAGALLFIEVDGHPAAIADEAGRIRDLCVLSGATSVRLATNAAEADRLAAARRIAYTALASMKPTTMLEDVTVPRSELAGMIRFIQEAAARHGLDIALFGHFGDGNLHPTILTDESDTNEMRRVDAAKREIFAHAVKLGGTITGEHGVGLTKKPYLRNQLGDASYDLMKRIKKALDPENLFNPGKVFDVTEM